MTEETRRMHYYGDIVRKLFVSGAVVMLITLPFVQELLPIPLFYSLLAIITFGFFAGFTNPTQLWVAAVNLIIATLAVIVFEYYAVDAFFKYGPGRLLFWANQSLAIIFFFALYFATKTLRGKIITGNRN